MNVTELIKDSLKYPISDWKKIVLLGIIIVIGGLSSLLNFLGVTNYVIILISLL